jgi:hypothetical protein
MALVVAGVAAAPPLAAQSRTSISLVPIGGYVLPTGNWTDDDTITLEPSGGIFVGLVAELAVNNTFSLAAQATRTLGLTQKLTWSSPQFFGQGTELETDLTSTQLIGNLVFRPMGRLPNGAPRTMYIEVGGGLMMYNVSKGFVDPSGQNLELDFDSSSPIVMAGLGFSFPAGPRASVHLFGRANYHVSKYESDGLDEWNSLSPPTTSEGKSTLVLQFGAGLRIGR